MKAAVFVGRGERWGIVLAALLAVGSIGGAVHWRARAARLAADVCALRLQGIPAPVAEATARALPTAVTASGPAAELTVTEDPSRNVVLTRERRADLLDGALLPDGRGRSALFDKLGVRLGADDLRRAMTPNGANDGEVVNLIQQLMPKLVDLDPRAAAEFVLGLPAGLAQDAAVGSLIAAWWPKDHKAVEVWLKGLPEGSLKEETIRSICSRLVYKEPAVAAEWLRQLKDEGKRAPLIAVIAEMWSRKNAAEAEGWAASLPAGISRDMAYAQIARNAVATDIATGVRCLQSIESPQQRAIVAAQLASAWAQRDPEAASAWLSRFEPGLDRDYLVAAFAKGMSRKSPAKAAQWAVSVGDPMARVKAIQSVMSSWLASDPTAATAWLNECDLAPSVKSEILAAGVEFPNG